MRTSVNLSVTLNYKTNTIEHVYTLNTSNVNSDSYVLCYEDLSNYKYESKLN